MSNFAILYLAICVASGIILGVVLANSGRNETYEVLKNLNWHQYKYKMTKEKYAEQHRDNNK